MDGYHQLAGKAVNFPPLFGDGHASEKIPAEILGAV
jgi:hypothetical protein